MSDPYVPESAMIIAAHPDDIEFTCAGTLALWAQRGARISYVLCTSGEAGIEDPALSPEEAARIREEEQRAAADIAGAADVVFLREPDGLLQATLDLRRRLAGKQYVYVWADGIYFNIRLADPGNARQCILVLMGATADGRKELLAVSDGYRESEQSWLELLLDLRSRGLAQLPHFPV